MGVAVGGFIDEAYTGSLEAVEFRLDVIYFKCQVMDALTFFLDEFLDDALGCCGMKQFQIGSVKGNKRKIKLSKNLGIR